MLSHLVTNVTRAVEKRYTWAQLEPTQDNYSFITNPGTDELRSDINWAAANNVRLVALIETKTFNNGELPGPAYLTNYTAIGSGTGTVGIGAAANGTQDCYVAMWDTFVTARFKLLLTNIATEFDSHLGFGGISTQETAMGASSMPDANLGIGGPVPAGKLFQPYTAVRLRDRYIEMITHHASVFQKSYFYWHGNFIRNDSPGQPDPTTGLIIEGVKSLGNFCLCGPDILPGNSSLENRFYPYFDTYRNLVPLLLEAQTDSYNWEGTVANPPPNGTFYTMPQIFSAAKNTYHCNIVVWTYVGGPVDPGSYDYSDAIPVMQNNPTWTP